MCVLKSACCANVLQEGLVGTPVSQQVAHGFGDASHGPRQTMPFMHMPQAIEKIVMDGFVSELA